MLVHSVDCRDAKDGEESCRYSWILDPNAAHPLHPLSTQPLLVQVRAKIRLKHYSIRTEQAYADWIRRYVLFHGKRHPSALGGTEVEAFLTHLAVDGKVAAATQNQAKSALLFLYREVLAIELPWLDKVARAKHPSRLPVVLTRDEVARILSRLRGVHPCWAGCSTAPGGGQVLRRCRGVVSGT